MKKYVGAAIGNCVHIGGAVNFLRFAEEEGHSTEFLGAAVSVKSLIDYVVEKKPDAVTIGFRLTAASVRPLLDELEKYIIENKLEAIEWIFGGTKPVANIAKEYKFFSKIFDGTEDSKEGLKYIKGSNLNEVNTIEAKNIIDRIANSYPRPVLRHHFGLPTLKETYEGIKMISDAKVLDIISVGPDQNAQENFFNQDKMNHDLDGAGGVPLRTLEDFDKLYDSAQTGNHPLLRCYSGTAEIFKFAELLKNRINNAWCAVPLCWYNVLDGRGKRSLVTSITEGQELMKWHAERDIPIEVNESHHWSLRDAHDTIAVAMAYLAAYNAKKMGVKTYIAQFMFNVPVDTHHGMDLAKMLAKIELIESLEDDNFKVFRQVRAGLASLSADLDVAKGQLAASTYLAMSLKPHIIHVVAFCEADHAAKPEDVIESCKIVKGVIGSTVYGMADMTKDESVQNRKSELISEANILLNTIKSLYDESKDPWSDPVVIADAIKKGLIDAPHLRGNKSAKGTLETRIVDGKCMAYSKSLGRVISEKERLSELMGHLNDGKVTAV